MFAVFMVSIKTYFSMKELDNIFQEIAKKKISQLDIINCLPTSIIVLITFANSLDSEHADLKNNTYYPDPNRLTRM